MNNTKIFRVIRTIYNEFGDKRERTMYFEAYNKETVEQIVYSRYGPGGYDSWNRMGTSYEFEEIEIEKL